jgi:anaphase-promoting complex subunit 10
MCWSCLILYETTSLISKYFLNNIWFPNFGTVIFCRETFVNTFMLQIAVLSNHLNGRDTHVRQIKVYGPQLCVFYFNPFALSFVHQSPITSILIEALLFFSFLFAFPVNDQFRNPFPHQPFQFTSREFITYSSVRWETW